MTDRIQNNNVVPLNFNNVNLTLAAPTQANTNSQISPWGLPPSLSQLGVADARVRTNIRAGLTMNTYSGAVEPVLGIQHPLSNDFALSLNLVSNPRDLYFGAMLRPGILLHPSSRVHASLFVEGGAGYFVEGLRATGGTGGSAVNLGLGMEICPEIIGVHMFCTAVSYNFGWIEPTVSRSMSAIRDEGWYYRDVVNITLTIGFGLGR